MSLLDERGLTLDTATAKAQSAIEWGASSFAPVLCTVPAADAPATTIATSATAPMV